MDSFHKRRRNLGCTKTGPLAAIPSARYPNCSFNNHLDWIRHFEKCRAGLARSHLQSDRQPVGNQTNPIVIETPARGFNRGRCLAESIDQLRRTRNSNRTGKCKAFTKISGEISPFQAMGIPIVFSPRLDWRT